MMIKRHYITVIFSLLTIIGCVNRNGQESSAPTTVETDSVSVLPPLDSLRCVEGKVRNGQFFSTLMTGLGLNAQEAYDLTIACDTVFNVKNLRVGNEYKAYYDGQVLKYVIYRQDRTADILFECQAPYRVTKVTRPVTVRKRYADVTINSSLWNDMRAAGASPLIILSLSDIYAWTVD